MLTWFIGIDLFSVATCEVPDAAVDIKGKPSPHHVALTTEVHIWVATECISDHGKALCKDINGVCITETDGYYIISAISIGFGIIFLIAFILPTARKLQSKIRFSLHILPGAYFFLGLPTSVWRVKMS